MAAKTAYDSVLKPVEGTILTVIRETAEELAKMPSKEELLAKILGSINSPATGIVGSINAVMAQLTRAMAAVRDQKSAQILP